MRKICGAETQVAGVVKLKAQNCTWTKQGKTLTWLSLGSEDMFPAPRDCGDRSLKTFDRNPPENCRNASDFISPSVNEEQDTIKKSSKMRNRSPLRQGKLVKLISDEETSWSRIGMNSEILAKNASKKSSLLHLLQPIELTYKKNSEKSERWTNTLLLSYWMLDLTSSIWTKRTIDDERRHLLMDFLSQIWRDARRKWTDIKENDSEGLLPPVCQEEGFYQAQQSPEMDRKPPTRDWYPFYQRLEMDCQSTEFDRSLIPRECSIIQSYTVLAF